MVKELFGECGERVKNLIFICLDSFKKEEFKNKKYVEFANMIFKELDNLNIEFSLHRLSIIAGSLEIIISKRASIIEEMHDKSITVKLLSFMPQTNQEVGEKILSVINKTLPTPD